MSWRQEAQRSAKIVRQKRMRNTRKKRNTRTRLRPFWGLFLNPPNGSWGMVKVRPTKKAALLNPPNGSWGIVKVRPTKEGALLNPPNGSWGMVKVRPKSTAFSFSRIPPTAVGGWLRFSLPDFVSRHIPQPEGRTLTIPQLPLGGFEQNLCLCRLGFNHPPTAVGGIPSATINEFRALS